MDKQAQRIAIKNKFIARLREIGKFDLARELAALPDLEAVQVLRDLNVQRRQGG